MRGIAKFFDIFDVSIINMGIRKLLFVVLVSLPLFMSAQKKAVWNKPLYDSYLYHFGFSFSLGALDFSVDHAGDFLDETIFDTVYSVEGIRRPIFGASIVTNLKLNDNFDLRFVPGLAFGQRDLQYLYLTDEKTPSGEDIFSYHDMKIESTYLQFPLLIKYRAVRENNYRPYIIAGLNYTYDLATRKKVKEEEKPKIRLNKHDVLLEVGFGVDSYLPYFKFSTELRFSYGLMNMIADDGSQYSQVFDKLGTKMVTLAIYFE